MRKGHKTLAASVAAVLLIVVLTIVGYRQIQKGVWAEEAAAERRALEETPLVEAEKIVPFYGKELMMVVHGKTESGQPGYAWVTDSEVRFARADEGVAESFVRAETIRRQPSADIRRVSLGMYRGWHAWEVLYTAEDGSGQTRTYYDYYRFNDGELLETVKLKA
ncbi:DUF5590 domain-containing protein [Paenibacillus thermoaerophilus]|uniref:DUF5590 domain-containing protein n=1 Tax=Paenibacillus thermoaerophilus TaxID=1215385 RepID=A0ABW2V6U6_9BACL|nr:DUF5590 domain-containing protein [Paenibacillus thermoaerophilus]TMV18667.1 hypothetical protein FE781_01640 [Paenibacillus thermoaerophilus]